MSDIGEYYSAKEREAAALAKAIYVLNGIRWGYFGNAEYSQPFMEALYAEVKRLMAAEERARYVGD